jgi:hypothetical protein
MSSMDIDWGEKLMLPRVLKCSIRRARGRLRVLFRWKRARINQDRSCLDSADQGEGRKVVDSGFPVDVDG